MTMDKKKGMDGYTIVVGVTGGIAAFRAVDLVSSLGKQGAGVHVVMTKGAMEFVRPLTFEAISGNTVHTDVFASPPGWKFPHLDLASQADVVVVAPATAHFLAQAAAGMAGDLLTTMLLACRGQVFICPAMNVNMYTHPAVQDNLKRLLRLGYSVVEPGCGRLACGDTGPGRLADINNIITQIKDYLLCVQDLKDYTILVTAGATREAIDPVRFLTNHSSGKMGFAIARAAQKRGARVILVSGPVHPSPPPGVEFIEVESARDMFKKVLNYYPAADAVIKAAAVADYRPREIAGQKIKKKDHGLVLELVKNPDILLELGKQKQNQILVGFAAETENIGSNAAAKIHKKNLDFIVANDVTVSGAGFGTDTNLAQLIFRSGQTETLPLMDKEKLGNIILDHVKKIKLEKE